VFYGKHRCETPGGPNPEEALSDMLKVELHTHTADDPVDRIPYTTFELIDRAVALGYDALAVTLHERQLDLRHVAPYAADRGLVLIPGVERTIGGKHVLLLNFKTGAEDVRTFSDLARLKSRRRGLVVAPHPYFPSTVCLRSDLQRHAGLFDAVERNAMFTSSVDFNPRAERWAEQNGKPVVGNCDVHRLAQLGTTYSLVDAPADADAICEAVVAGRVRVESRPLAWTDVVRTLSSMAFASIGGGRLKNGFDANLEHLEVGEPGVLKMRPPKRDPITVA
jgi:predicted metal-dependent phosphoesterase TrpH